MRKTFFYLDLKNQTNVNLKEALATIPADTSSLCISSNCAIGENAIKLNEVLRSIPPTVFHLSFVITNEFEQRSIEELKEAFASIPLSVTDLYLKGQLHHVSAEQLNKILASLHLKISRLNLDGNSFQKKSTAELKQAFSSISSSIRHLSLEFNNFYSKSGAELRDILSVINAGVTHLNLGYNSFCSKNGIELKEAFTGIPQGVSHLNLGGNSLGYKCFQVENPLEALAGIPPSVWHLDLSDNKLYESDLTELKTGLTALPSNVTSLNLSKNKLCKIKDNLEKFKNSLPHVKTIYLSYQEVAVLTENQRIALGAVFPNVEKIILLDSDSTEADPLFTANFIRQLGKKQEAPSLFSTAKFFVRNHNELLKKARELSLPDVQESDMVIKW